MIRVMCLIAIVVATATPRIVFADGCVADTDCKGGRVCEAGVCTAPTQTSCSKDTDCPGALICAQNVCEAPAQSAGSGATTTAPAAGGTPAAASSSVAAPSPVVPAQSAPAAPAVMPPPPAPGPTVAPPPPAYGAPMQPLAPTVGVGASAAPPPPLATDDWWRHRQSFAYDFEAALGVFGAVGKSASDGYAAFGGSAGLGVYVSRSESGAVALMAMSAFDAVNTKPEISAGFFGGGLRWSAGSSNSSFRIGIGGATLTDTMTHNGITGLGFVATGIVAGRGHVGLAIDANLGVYDSLAIVKFALGLALTD